MSARTGRLPLLATLAAALLLPACDLFTGSKPDRTAPTVTIESPAAGTRTRGPAVDVHGTARDTSGVERVTYALNSTDPAAERPADFTPGTEAHFFFKVPDLAQGSNTIHVFAYDRRGNRGTTTLTVNFAPNRAPVAQDDTASTRSDSTVTIVVLPNDTDPDGDSLRVDRVSQPELGISSANQNGTVVLIPDSTRTGTVSFTYVVYDRFGAADTARVTVTIRPKPATHRYTVRVIETPQSLNTAVVDLNDQGQVLLHAYSTFSPDQLSILWENGTSTIIGRVPLDGQFDVRGKRALTHALNDVGQQLFSYCSAQTGFNTKSCTQYSFAVGDTTRTLRDFTTFFLPEGLRFRLNNAGYVVLGGLVWLGGGARVTLPPAGGRSWTPVELSDASNFAGVTTDAPYAAVVARRITETVLVAVGDSAGGTDVNEAAQLVGVARDASGRFAFMWENGGISRAPVQRLPGTAAAGTSVRINERSEIVYVTDAPRTVRYWRNSAIARLDDLLLDTDWETTGVAFINDVGQIVAYARRKSTGTVHPVLLTPTR